MRYVIVYFVHQPSSSPFSSSDWPLHVTLVPPFNTTASFGKIVHTVKNALRPFKPITIKAVERSRFGNHGHKQVTLLQAAPKLVLFHESLMQALMPLSPSLQSASHTKNNFRPHVSDQAYQSLGIDMKLYLDRIWLVGYDDSKRILLEYFDLSS